MLHPWNGPRRALARVEKRRLTATNIVGIISTYVRSVFELPRKFVSVEIIIISLSK
jgi:hypothetical protein